MAARGGVNEQQQQAKKRRNIKHASENQRNENGFAAAKARQNRGSNGIVAGMAAAAKGVAYHNGSGSAESCESVSAAAAAASAACWQRKR